MTVESRLSAIENSIDETRSLISQNDCLFDSQSIKNRKKRAPESGFEPELEPRQPKGSISGFEALNNIISVAELNSSRQETLATLEFRYTKEELDSYFEWHIAGFTHKSSNWIKKAADTFWSHAKGRISKTSLEALQAFDSASM